MNDGRMDLGSQGTDTLADADTLILVDEADREVGHMSKAQCHDGRGILHRAFSLLIFNAGGELLLQQRAASKRLWPLFLFKFQYHAQWDASGAENELCSVYIGRTQSTVRADPREIAGLRWVAPEALQAEMAERRAGQFTPWFIMEWERIWSDHRPAVLATRS